MPILGACDGDYGLKLRFLCWNWNEAEQHEDFIGEFETTLDTIVNQKQNAFDLKNSHEEVSRRF